MTVSMASKSTLKINQNFKNYFLPVKSITEIIKFLVKLKIYIFYGVLFDYETSITQKYYLLTLQIVITTFEARFTLKTRRLVRHQ